MVLSLVFVGSYNFGWSPVYGCKAYWKLVQSTIVRTLVLVDIFCVAGTLRPPKFNKIMYSSFPTSRHMIDTMT